MDERTKRNYEMDVDEFLAHTGGGGGGGGFLTNWRKDGKIDIWMHPAALPAKLWSHRWYTIAKDRETGDPVLRSMRFNSLESEGTLKRRYYRGTDGTLDFPPQVCPFAKLLEWVHQAIVAGRLKWTDTIFVFDEVAPEVEIRAGGFTGLFGKKDITPEEKRELNRAGVSIREAWKENGHARLQYVFRVVKNAAPEDGCLIALESQALGDKIKRVISDRIDDCSSRRPPEPDLGDPFKNPYAFRWVYDESADFSQRYEARSMISLELTPEIQAVFDAAPPDITDLMAPGSLDALRNSFEEHWASRDVTPPWDELFEAATRDAAGEVDHGEEPWAGARRAARATRDSKAEDPAPRGRTAAVAPAPEPEEELFECDVCAAEMTASETKCRNCGTEYDADGNILKRGKAPPRRRSGAKRDEDDFPKGYGGSR